LAWDILAFTGPGILWIGYTDAWSTIIYFAVQGNREFARYLLFDTTESQGHAPQRWFQVLTAWVWSWPFDLLLAARSPPEARLELMTSLSQPGPCVSPKSY